MSDAAFIAAVLYVLGAAWTHYLLGVIDSTGEADPECRHYWPAVSLVWPLAAPIFLAIEIERRWGAR